MARSKWLSILMVVLAGAGATPGWAQQTASKPADVDYAALEMKQAYTPSEENLKAREWFQDAKFGMFIHWGVYSVLAKGEWVMQHDKMNIEQYEQLPPKFNPTKFDADAWVKMAKDAGVGYLIFTTKHHDGFAMFDSKVSVYDVVDRTAYKQDVLKMLADACHKQGVKLILYHSLLDWHSNDYSPRGKSGQYSSRPVPGSWYQYLDYMDTQLTELLRNYGEIAGIWFDGWWDKPKGGLAARPDLQTDPQSPATGAHLQQSPPVALPRRGLPGLREESARREGARPHHRPPGREPPLGVLRYDQHGVGLQ